MYHEQSFFLFKTKMLSTALKYLQLNEVQTPCLLIYGHVVREIARLFKNLFFLKIQFN